MTSTTTMQWKEWKIPAGNEHRFEVPFEVSFHFKLLEGTAEIFGSELAPGREYTVSGCKLAIFTFTGARVSYQGGPCSVEYLSSEPPVAQEALLNLHVALEGAVKRTGKVPRVLLLGVGRNTVARTLTNYAVRRMENDVGPILVDLDVSNGSVCLPGTLSAVTPNRPLEVEESAWHSQPQAQMISLFYGATAIADNPKVYTKLCDRFGEIVRKRAEKNCSVIFVLAPAELSNEASSNQSTQSLLQCLQKSFDIDHVLVIGNERLHVTVSKILQSSDDSAVKVLKVPRAGGVVTKDSAYRRSAQAKAFKSYFYGPRGEFHPFSLTLSLTNVVIYRVADTAALAPSSALPLGATRKIDSSKLTKVTDLNPSQMLYSILAVVRGPETGADEFEEALEAPVAGFLHVLEVDEGKQTVTVLAPCPGTLPSKFLLLSSLKWIEK